MPTWFDRLLASKRWGSIATLAEPSDTQANTGFSFLGQAPPSTGLHDALFQYKDDVDIYLFNHLKAVLTAGGVTPTATDTNGLLIALRAMFASRIFVFTASGNFTVPSGVNKLKVSVVGSGGGGAGTGTPNTGGGGGGGGGFAYKICSVSAGDVVPVTVGGSVAGTTSAGANGNTSSFGTFCSATGGAGGAPFAGSPAGGAGGAGFGGDLNLNGCSGSDGGSTTAYGGAGGAPGGIGGGAGRGGVNTGTNATSYGAGGGGGYLTEGTLASGGNSAAGLVIVEY